MANPARFELCHESGLERDRVGKRPKGICAIGTCVSVLGTFAAAAAMTSFN